MAQLALVRHGESEYNAQNLWAGLHDIELTELGRRQARACARALQDIVFHHYHSSALKRAKDTLTEIQQGLNGHQFPTYEHAALNERDYGALTAKNKEEMRQRVGDEQFKRWRRGWDEPIPDGESLKDVHSRVAPYFVDSILPQLRSGENVLVAAHSNSLRALVKHLEAISDEDIVDVELGNCEIYLYTVDAEGNITKKEVRLGEIEKEPERITAAH